MSYKNKKSCIVFEENLINISLRMEENCFYYVDESGSMVLDHKGLENFIIAVVKIRDKKKVKKIFDRLYVQHKNDYFVKSSNNKFEIHTNKLYRNKKLALADYFCRAGLIEVFFIKVSNDLIIENDFYSNKARAFNYLLDIFFRYQITKENIPANSNHTLFIDNRNVAVQSLKSLEDYLNVSLKLERRLAKNFLVNYVDSANVPFVQIADFFSNFYYCYLYNPSFYQAKFKRLVREGVIKSVFNFPIKKDRQ